MRLIDAESLKELFPDNGEGSWTYNATAKAYIDARPTIQPEMNCSEIPNNSDTISRQAAIDKINEQQRKLIYCFGFENDMVKIMDIAKSIITIMPSVQPETCEGCKHLGKWENEVEYGYPSPCTRCKRRVNDNYER